MTAMISDSSPQAGGRTKPRERPGGRQVLHGRAAEQRTVRDLPVFVPISKQEFAQGNNVCVSQLRAWRLPPLLPIDLIRS